MLRKLCLGMVACSAFAGTLLVGMEEADALPFRARRVARRQASQASYYSRPSTYTGQPTAADQAPQPPNDPGAPPAQPTETNAAPPPDPSAK